jgi:hypothetical protein
MVKITWARYAESDFKRTPIAPVAIAPTIAHVRGDWSSMLVMDSGDEEVSLMITSSLGGYAALLRANGSFYDLVGDRDARGFVEFVHGGQPRPHPRRHLIGVDLASLAAKRFCDDTNAILAAHGLDWEEQG